jgi:glycosyltransferase involved in cell wall biosynthesis
MPERPLRIAFVIDDMGHGGAQKQLSLIAAALAPRYAPRAYVLSSVAEPHGPALRAQGVPVDILRRRSGADPARLVTLTRAVRNADIVHGFLDASNAYAFIAARLVRRPVVLFMSSDRLTLRGWRRVAVAWMYRHADAVTVNSRAGEAFLVDRLRVPPDRVYVVPNIVSVPEARPAPPAGAAPLVGCVGRLADEKRFDRVVAALPAVRAAVPGARLRIVGDGPGRAALEAAAARAGVAGAVTFAGAVDRPMQSMADMSCLVLSSEFEGLPNAALEAMSIGIPVVAVSVGDLASIVVDGVTGVRAEDASPAALARAIVRALSDPHLRDAASREGPRLMRERFAEDGALSVLNEMYASLATKRKRARSPE